jgi:hypothetical protein
MVRDSLAQRVAEAGRRGDGYLLEREVIAGEAAA